MTTFRVTARRVGTHPEAWAGFWWYNGVPHCAGDNFASRREAYEGARIAEGMCPMDSPIRKQRTVEGKA